MELPAEIAELLKRKKFSQVEDLWMERLESRPEEIGFFQLLARDLGRAGEKEQAAFLLELLAQNYREREDHRGGLELLKQASSLAPGSKELRGELRDTLRRLYPGRPHFNDFVTRSELLGSSPPEKAVSELEHLLANITAPHFGLDLNPAALGSSTQEALVALAAIDRIFLVHLDNAAPTDEGRRQTFLDEGPIDVPQILQALKAKGFQGPLRAAPPPLMAADGDWGHKSRSFDLGYLRAVLQSL